MALPPSALDLGPLTCCSFIAKFIHARWAPVGQGRWPYLMHLSIRFLSSPLGRPLGKAVSLDISYAKVSLMPVGRPLGKNP